MELEQPSILSWIKNQFCDVRYSYKREVTKHIYLDSFKIICIRTNCKQNAYIIYLNLNRFELVGIFLERTIMHPVHLKILCFVLGTQSFLIQGNVWFENHYLFNSNNEKWIWCFTQDIIIVILITDT